MIIDQQKAGIEESLQDTTYYFFKFIICGKYALKTFNNASIFNELYIYINLIKLNLVIFVISCRLKVSQKYSVIFLERFKFDETLYNRHLNVTI